MTGVYVCVWVCVSVCVCERERRIQLVTVLFSCFSHTVSGTTPGEKVGPDSNYKNNQHTLTRANLHKGRGRQGFRHIFTCSFPRFHEAAAIWNLEGLTSKQPLKRVRGLVLGKGHKTLRGYPQSVLFAIRLRPQHLRKSTSIPSPVSMNIHGP